MTTFIWFFCISSNSLLASSSNLRFLSTALLKAAIYSSFVFKLNVAIFFFECKDTAFFQIIQEKKEKLR